MSDGPHRSLKMKAWWKEFAKRLEISAYSQDEARDCLKEALIKDFRKEVSSKLLETLTNAAADPQGQLYSEHSPLLDQVRSNLPENGFAQLISDCLMAQASNQIAWGDVVPRGIEQAMGIWAVRQIRTVEEHNSRNSGSEETVSFRQKLESVVGGLDFNSLVSDICTNPKPASSQFRAKQEGVDDGPGLQ